MEELLQSNASLVIKDSWSTFLEQLVCLLTVLQINLIRALKRNALTSVLLKQVSKITDAYHALNLNA